MDFALVALVAFAAAGLTLYSGFGLGTVLLPAFALFFPAPVAVAATGVVHLVNNLFRGALLRKLADWPTVLRFGLPAVPAAIAGAWALSLLGRTPRLVELHAFGTAFGPSGAGLTIGLLMILFAILELQPRFQKLRAPARMMPFGGALTGFLGGLTGQQGALRSMFLLKAGLDARHFVATGVMVAILVDLARLGTYASAFATSLRPSGQEAWLVLAGTASALAGSYFGVRFLHKVTIGAVRRTVAALMLTIGAGLATGLLGS